MFREILQLIISEKIMSKSIIAQRIGVSSDTVEDMLRLLIERGYLQEDDCVECEPIKCAGCPSSSHCSTDVPVASTITVTEKGLRYAST
jgi:hypothetical protein